MKTITIQVTQEDIERGLRGDCAFCPIALSMRRSTGEFWAVTGRAATPYAGHWTDSVTLPQECEGFISAFDKGYVVSPFSFSIEVPE